MWGRVDLYTTSSACSRMCNIFCLCACSGISPAADVFLYTHIYISSLTIIGLIDIIYYSFLVVTIFTFQIKLISPYKMNYLCHIFMLVLTNNSLSVYPHFYVNWILVNLERIVQNLKKKYFVVLIDLQNKKVIINWKMKSLL